MAHAAFNWQDPFLLNDQLSDDERMVREAAAAYCQDALLPHVDFMSLAMRMILPVLAFAAILCVSVPISKLLK